VDRKGSFELTPLRKLTRAERAAVDDEGERLVEFFRDQK
jgi:hypothetical protein